MRKVGDEESPEKRTGAWREDSFFQLSLHPRCEAEAFRVLLHLHCGGGTQPAIRGIPCEEDAHPTVYLAINKPSDRKSFPSTRRLSRSLLSPHTHAFPSPSLQLRPNQAYEKKNTSLTDSCHLYRLKCSAEEETVRKRIERELSIRLQTAGL